MKVTSSDIETVVLVIKGVINLIVKQTKSLIDVIQGKAINPKVKAEIKQLFQPVVAEDDIYDIPAITRLRHINLYYWQVKNISEFKPNTLGIDVQKPLDDLKAKGLRPSSLYWDV